jgi:hypothetical protein
MLRLRLAAGGAAVGLLLTALTGCSGTSVTAARVDRAVGPAFARLYALQQSQLGNVVVNRPDGRARCARNNTANPTSGAGDDWACILNFPYADGHIQPITYDLTVQPDGCYTADGPSQIVGQQQQRTSSQTEVTNPLFAFDGCFDAG